MNLNLLGSFWLRSSVLAATAPSGFRDGMFAGRLNQPLAPEFTPDGLLFILLKSGTVCIVKQGKLIVFLFLTLLGAVFIQAQDIRTPDLKGDDSFANVIFRLEDGAMEQWRQGNPMRWIEISADDISYLDPSLTAPVVGIDAYRKYLKPLVGKIAYDGSEYVEPRVARYGNIAVLTYNYHSLSKDKDGHLKRMSFWNTTEVYSLVAGKWKIVHTHWSHIDHHLPDKLEMSIPVNLQEKKLEGVSGELLALEAAAMERWRKGDPYGFLDMSAPGVTYFDTGTPRRLNGLNELRAEVQKRGKQHIS